MNKIEEFGLFSMVIILVLATVLLLFSVGYLARMEVARAACEAELPRNQSCVLIAVPENNNLGDVNDTNVVEIAPQEDEG